MVMWGIASTSVPTNCRWLPSMTPEIMIVKPTPVATPMTPMSVWRTRFVTWAHAMKRMGGVLIRLFPCENRPDRPRDVHIDKGAFRKAPLVITNPQGISFFDLHQYC